MALQLKFGRVPSTKKRDEQINPIFNFLKLKMIDGFVLVQEQVEIMIYLKL